MKVCDHISSGHVFLGIPLADKEEVLRFVARVLAESGLVPDQDALHKAMAEREKIMTTGIGGGIGIPHAVVPGVTAPVVVLIRPENPVPFESLDQAPVDVILAMVVSPHDKMNHLRLLAGISRLCKNNEFLAAVREAASSRELWDRIARIEEAMAFH